ncbi:ABC transporter permease [Oceanotoga sp. DSM 15011]|uniref:ABC transporter permease n=1 Tax=Oceanotoga sp. DSM 15011 TaxID=2984951 RepID=UPI0021F3E3D0|nr:ABC transporter permease [Oceanotoga sp. DSM 15011]UYO99820.1 ABC transporter permease [Oceanotoga sp. DSM 15011]
MRWFKLTSAMIKDNFRQFDSVFWTIIFPSIFLLFFISIFGNVQNNEENIEFKVGIYYENQDIGILKNILNNVFEDEEFKKTFKISKYENFEKSLEDLKEYNIDIIAYFPEDINKVNFFNLNDDKPIIKIYRTQKNYSKITSEVFSSVLNEINLRFNTMGRELNIETDYIYLNTNDEGFVYEDFIFPGILMMAILTVSIFNLPLNFVDYKNRGIIKRVFVTPLKMSHYFYSFLISNFSILFLAIILLYFEASFLNISTLIFNYKFIFFLLYCCITALSFGLIIASFFRRIGTASSVSNIVYFITIFLSGLYFPTKEITSFVRWYVYINPATYMVDGLRNILSGDSIGIINIIVPAIWFLIGLILFSFNFKRVMSDEK